MQTLGPQDQEVSSAALRLMCCLCLQGSRPQWRTPLLDACGLIQSLAGRGQEAWLNNGEGLTARNSLSTESLEGLYDLQSLCRVLQPREVKNMAYSLAYACVNAAHTNAHSHMIFTYC